MDLFEDKYNTFSSWVLEDYCHNFSEYEQGSSEPVVKGRIKSHFKSWENINANPWVLDVVNNGYSIPFDNLPKPCVFLNNRSAIDNSQFVHEAVFDLLSKGLIVPSHSLPQVVNPLISFYQQNR